MIDRLLLANGCGPDAETPQSAPISASDALTDDIVRPPAENRAMSRVAVVVGVSHESEVAPGHAGDSARQTDTSRTTLSSI